MTSKDLFSSVNSLPSESCLDKSFIKIIDNDKIETISYRTFCLDLIFLTKKKRGIKNNVLLIQNSYFSILNIFSSILTGDTTLILDEKSNIEHVKKPKLFKISSDADILKILGARKRDSSLKFKFKFKRKTTKICFPTSGSTGEPKIVSLTMLNLMTNVQDLISHHNLNPKSKIGTAMPISHVNAFGFSMLCTFFCRGELILWKNQNISLLSDQINAHKINIYSASSNFYNLFNKVISNEDKKKFRQLKYFVAAATYLNQKTIVSIFRKTKKPILQGYGLSEAVNFSTIFPLNFTSREYRKMMLECEHPSIGVSLPSNRISIIKNNKICNEGELGEIHISGKNVMNGYLFEQSKNYFSEYGLKTGDIGYYKIFKSKKYFFLVSRIKDIIKKNGKTVSLSFIDSHFNTSSVQNVDFISVGFTHEFRGEEIGLIFQINKNSKVDYQKIYKHIKKIILLLPTDLRPLVVIEVAKPLRTNSGKPKRHLFLKKLNKQSRKKLISTSYFFLHS